MNKPLPIPLFVRDEDSTAEATQRIGIEEGPPPTAVRRSFAEESKVNDRHQ